MTPDPETARHRFAERLREAGVDTQRFIDVKDGAKASHDHTQYEPDSDRLSGNYGVYGGSGADANADWILIDVDIDDYKKDATGDALDAIQGLPETFTTESPHTDGKTGGHEYYAVPIEALEQFEDEFGTENVNTSWGDVHVKGKYVVGPGSQLDGCGKDWCSDCAKPDRGYYRIANDAPVARVDTDELIEAIAPGVEDHNSRKETTLDEFDGVDEDLTPASDDTDKTLSGGSAREDSNKAPDGFDYDADLTIVADALSAINPDVSRDVWLRLGFAVHAAGPGPDGKQLFERWSRNGQKWDDAAAYDTDWIWENASAGTSITPGTLFHYARKAGWEGAEPTTALPLATLDALSPDERKRAARKRGCDIPSTAEARTQLCNTLFRELRAENTTVIDAPTALGKSYTVATEPWRRRADVTGETPVIHLHPTRDARDEAAHESQTASVTYATLKGRGETCPVARGDHDPPNDPDSERAPDVIVTVDGEPASEWFRWQCDHKDLPFSVAHAVARDRNDQGLDALPCCEGKGAECPAVAQWNGIPRDDAGDPAVDVVHATHQFAYVPSLRRGTNVILDEQPDFTVDLSQNRVERMVTAYLREIDAPVGTWEALVSLARMPPGGRSDAARERDEIDALLGQSSPRPPTEWYVEEPDAHALAPDLTRAVWKALRWEDADANGRRSTKVLHEPPRFDAGEGDGYAGTWLSIVIDDENTVCTVRSTPDFSQARAVIGLDAHPVMPMWELNAGSGMTREVVLEPGERRLWRRYERGLTVVQVGDATRPRSGTKAREWLNEDRVRTILERLHDHYGDDFGTAISPIQVEDIIQRLLADIAGEETVINDESTMHYGEEKSRNDFADEPVGYLYGCMDPGDDMILDTLAELGVEAEPATAVTDDGEEYRARGRGFEGSDADTAVEILASVRENHVAQGAGRYARAPDDPESGATVFVHTDAMPPGFADIQAAGVEWLASETQQPIVEALADRPSATTRELADAVGCSKEHVRGTLERLEAEDVVARYPGTGEHGADVFRADGVVDALADLGLGDIANEALRDPDRWSLAIPPAAPSGSDETFGGSAPTVRRAGANRGEPPPDTPG